MGWDCLAYKSYWLRDHFRLVARLDHTIGSRNIKPMDKNPQAVKPLPLKGREPHLTHQFLGQPHLTPHRATRSPHAFYTTTQQIPYWLQWMRHFHPQNCLLPCGDLPLFTSLIFGPSRLTTLNNIQIQSAIFPRYTGQTDRPTDRQMA